jgi:hypothetical protein
MCFAEQTIPFLCYSVTYLQVHGDVGVFSNWSVKTSTCMCSTNLLSYTRTMTYTLETKLTEKIRAK